MLLGSHDRKMWCDQGISLSDSAPDSLFDICMEVIVNNLDTISECHPTIKGRRKIKNDIVLPAVVCEKFLEAYQKRRKVDNNIAFILEDCKRTRLKLIRLRNTHISDQGFRCLLQHKPHDLDVVQGDFLTPNALDIINKNSENLVSLRLGTFTFIISENDTEFRKRGYILEAPNLRKLTIQDRKSPLYPLLLLKSLTKLTHLDLSQCNNAGRIWALRELTSLQSLIIHSVDWAKEVIDWIITMKTLRHLDISQNNERNGEYQAPNHTLNKIVTHLVNLESLDISGTNLAGTGAAVQSINGGEEVRCDIPGLVSRVDNPLQFLGLYGTHSGACKRHDIPAIVISGDANEDQILTASIAYMDRVPMLTQVLNDLYYLFRYENNVHVARALSVVLEAMGKHKDEKLIQISGSATLFYIVKGREKANIGVSLKRRIITALLVGMEAHIGDDTMMRNGCLTLCQFKIPNDVLFEYKRVVLILLNGMADVNQESFVQRIAIYLLNSLACQVDGNQKIFLGNNGAIEKMLHLISDRLDRHVCDDVLEVAWSTMWNVTDETPQNCQRFLDNHGMHFFLSCIKYFPSKEELLRNMMGLLGNVAEVAGLRPQLMNQLFLSVFYELLDSSSDGIEVSYNAAGVLAHMASDGPESWTVERPDRHEVLARVADAVERWDLHAERNINYRSFEPILALLSVHHTPQCQHWAVWALANLTTVYPDKYCSLVESEGGITLLVDLLNHPAPYKLIKDLAQVVIVNCATHAADTANTANKHQDTGDTAQDN